MSTLTIDPSQRFVDAPNGTPNFGDISAEAAAALGARPGPIRIQRGIPGPRGYGYLHVHTNPERMRLIGGIGFGSFEAFAFDIAQHYQTIHRGDDGRFLVCYRKLCDRLFDLRLIVEQAGADDTYWNVITGVFSPRCRAEVLFRK